MELRLSAMALGVAALASGQNAWAGEAEAKKWIDAEFQPSTLTKEQQTAEMKWFIDAAKKLQGKGVKEISVVSETITTHESKQDTGQYRGDHRIKVKRHHPGLETQHRCSQASRSTTADQRLRLDRHALPLGRHEPTDYMAVGKEYTNPTDLKDFIGTSFTTAPDGKLYQLRTSSLPICTDFAPIYSRASLQVKFKAKYAYDLGCR
jgi:glycerol transport system substrate-binding protein